MYCQYVSVARFGVQGSQGWRATSRRLITKINLKTKRKYCRCGLFFVGVSSSALLAVSLCISMLATVLLSAGRRGPFMSLRQSLESDTGVNYHSLAKRFPARLQTCSPPSAFSLPTRPSPHTPTARLRPVSSPACSPPPPISGEEVSCRHLHPRPVDHPWT